MESEPASCTVSLRREGLNECAPAARHDICNTAHTLSRDRTFINDEDRPSRYTKPDLTRRAISDSGFTRRCHCREPSPPPRPMLRKRRQDQAVITPHIPVLPKDLSPASPQIQGLSIEPVATQDFGQPAHKIHHVRHAQQTDLLQSSVPSLLDLHESASRTATIEGSWRSNKFESESDATERYNSPSRTGSFEDDLASVSSRYSDNVAEGVVLNEGARSFPPRMPGHFSSNQAKNRAVKNIQSWIKVRANSPELSSNQIVPRGRATALPSNRSASDKDSDSSLSADEAEHLWGQLLAKRHQVKKIRRSMATTRSQLRSVREELFNADNKFMTAVRPIVLGNQPASPTPSVSLQRLLAELQSLRTEVQDLELKYDEADRQLWKKESQLSRLEVQFYSLLGQPGDEIEESDDTFSDAPCRLDVPLDLKGIGSERSFDTHPLYARLEHAVAQYRSWQDEYSDLWEARERSEEQLLRNERLEGAIAAKQQLEPQTLEDPELILSRETLEFLDDFTENEVRISNQLLESEQEVSRLWQRCREKDVVPERPHINVLAAVFPDSTPIEDIDLGDDETILSERTELAHPVFSELLSQPNHLLEHPEPLTPQLALLKASETLADDDYQRRLSIRKAQREVEIDQLLADRDKMTTATFVDKWILFRLRTSPLDVALMFNIFLKRLRVRNVVRWQRDVLKLWNQDGLARVMDRHQAYNEENQYLTRLGTPQRSRAASDTPEKPSRHHVRASSIGSAVLRGSTP